jgi:polar amino acid transport system substrate-binding protein
MTAQTSKTKKEHKRSRHDANALAVFVFIMMAAIVQCWSISSATAEPITLEVGQPEFYPLSYTGKSGKPEGLLVNIMAKVAPEAGYGFKVSFYPGKRLFANLENGRVQVWMGIGQWAPNGTTLVGSTPLSHIELRVYYLDAPPITSKDELKGMNIALLRGYSYGDWRDYILNPQNGIVYHEIDSREAALKMLKSKRVDYYIDYKRPSTKAIEITPVPGIRHTVISSFDCYFVVSRKLPEAQHVLKRLEDAYKRLVARKIIDPDL